MAGDWSYGGLKGMRGTSVPVPAPVPVPIYEPKWYLRGDVGFILRSAPGASESGIQYEPAGDGTTFGLGDPTYFSPSSWSDDFGIGPTFSFGAGYHWSKDFRTDVTIGFHSDGKLLYNGEYRYEENAGNPGDTTYRGQIEDRTIQRTGTMLFNAYYDFSDWGRFRPYIGAGLGFAVSKLERRHSFAEGTCTTAVPADPPCTVTYGPVTPTSASTYAVSLAAAATAGITYNLGEYTSLDLNYRYLYTGGTHVGMNIGGSNSDLDIDAQHQHQFRAGLRWDIN
jgi:opacity protein-like surface antigen